MSVTGQAERPPHLRAHRRTPAAASPVSFEHPSLVDDRLEASRGALLESWGAMTAAERAEAADVTAAIRRRDFGDPRIVFHRIQVRAATQGKEW